MAEVGRGAGHQDQVRPGLGEGLGDARPDPPACASDEGNVPVKPELISACLGRRRWYCLGHVTASLRELFVTEIMICY